MSKGVHELNAVCQLAHIAAIRQLHALGHSHYHRCLLLMKLLHLFHESIHVKGHLRKEQHIRPLAVLSLCESSCSCQPACVPAHDFQDGHILLVIYQSVTDDLLCNGADILGCAAISGGMVCGRQVIVNGLWNAHKADSAAVEQGIVGKLLNGVHGVIAADIEKVLYLQLVQNGKYLIVYLPVITNLRQLETAGTQISGGRSFQKLNIQIRLDVLLQIHIPLLQKPLYAVEHAVHLPGAPVLGCLKHACQAGINHCGWTSGLPYDYITFYLCHRNTSIHKL